MTEQEFQAWAKFQARNAGHWTVDPIHNGIERDLIAYVAKPADPTSGIYINIMKDGTWDCGRFTDAVPHMGDACYAPSKRGKAESFDAALKHLIERLGLSFLLALTHGVSPYRSL